jgi:hypothetical protein
LLLCLALGCAQIEKEKPEPPPDKQQRALFGLMGDAPYSEAEARRIDSLINAVNDEKLAFLAHVGDITSGRGPCTDEWFAARKAQFARIRHPFILLPGDNDWVDCHRSGFDPLERLARWRSLFCVSPDKFALKIERQSAEYCEHVRWEFDGVLFVAVNVQGTNNNLGRNKAMDAEHAARMREVLAWLDDSEKLFSTRNLAGMVVLMQANPFLKPRLGGRNGFESILAKLQALGIAYPRRVALVHGDTHIFHDDHPLPGVHRVEVYGSPMVAWLRASASGAGIQVEPGGQY